MEGLVVTQPAGTDWDKQPLYVLSTLPICQYSLPIAHLPSLCQNWPSVDSPRNEHWCIPLHRISFFFGRSWSLFYFVHIFCTKSPRCWDNSKEIVSNATACKRSVTKEQSSFVSMLKFSWKARVLYILYPALSVAKQTVCQQNWVFSKGDRSAFSVPAPQSPRTSFY